MAAAPPPAGILKNPLPSANRLPLARVDMPRKNSLPSYSASVEHPLVELKRLLNEREVPAAPAARADQTSALFAALEARENQAATATQGMANAIAQLASTLDSLNQTMQAQNRWVERIERLTEDQVKLGIEHRLHMRAQTISQARAYNASMVSIANFMDSARFAPLTEVPNAHGVFPSAHNLPTISSAQLLLALDLPTVKDYLAFYGIERPVCLHLPTDERRENLCKFVLSRHLGCYSLIGKTAAEFGGQDSQVDAFASRASL